ncbi:FkbM family methyltransferase [Bacteriovoracaceae bacterium]|nr:FkbM family methyltransferase [Bacteriovoracaceae bacterium]
MNFSNKLQLFKTRKINFCDIGARGGLPDIWSEIKEDVYGIMFEADPEECKKLDQMEDCEVFPYALDEKDGEHVIYLTKERRCSSFYPPNIEILKMFPEVCRFTIEGEFSVETKSMDSLIEGSESLKYLDFLKVDTQGSELDILRGAKEVLKNVIGTEVEVEFLEIYKGQHLFRDVDSFMYENGFELFDLRKTYWKSKNAIFLGSPKGKLIFADTLYLKTIGNVFDLCREKEKDARNIIINALIIARTYGAFDYAFDIISNDLFLTYFNKNEKEEILKILMIDSKSFNIPFLLRVNIPLISSAIAFIAMLFKPNSKGWSFAENNLGSRKRRGLFYTN